MFNNIYYSLLDHDCGVSSATVSLLNPFLNSSVKAKCVEIKRPGYNNGIVDRFPAIRSYNDVEFTLICKKWIKKIKISDILFDKKLFVIFNYWQTKKYPQHLKQLIFQYYKLYFTNPKYIFEIVNDSICIKSKKK